MLGRLLDGRSTGVKDMRNGALLEEEWDVPASLLDRDSVPLPDARQAFVSGGVTKDPEDLAARIVGDMLVRVPSAAGPELVSQTFEIEAHHHGGVWHHELQNHPAVYARLLALLRGEGGS